MKKNIALLLFIFTLNLTLIAQVTDSFTDGNFNINPIWNGNDTNFIVDLNELKSNSSKANNSFYLSTPSTIIDNVSWSFKIRLAFNTSSANYLDVYVIANQADLKSTTLNGYFIRIGGTNDRVSLFKKTSTTETEIITGVNGSTNATGSEFIIKLYRNASGNFTLSRNNVAGTNNIIEGSVLDNTHNTTSSFGFLIKQSTASFFKKHFLDDVVVNFQAQDTIPPSILSTIAVSNNTVDITYNEVVTSVSASNILNYNINNGITISGANLISANVVRLNTSILTPLIYTLTINSVEDLANNVIATNTQINFTYVAPIVINKRDLIINEIYADNSSTSNNTELEGKGEFIELYNRTNNVLNLSGIKIKINATTYNLQNKNINPNSYLIICASTDTNYYRQYSATITTLGALTNGGANLQLLRGDGLIIDEINYTDDWYKNFTKQDGGYTLEKINPNDSCEQFNNWIASNNSILGGTPGDINSIFTINQDVSAPNLVSTITLTKNSILLTFSESIDTLQAKLISNYITSNGLAISLIQCIEPFNILKVYFSTNIDTSLNYTLIINNLQDCNGNKANGIVSNFTITKIPKAFQIIINEIMPDPDPTIGLPAIEYIELFNNSSNTFNLKDIQLKTGNNAVITLPNYFLNPLSYVVLVKQDASTLNIANAININKDLNLSNEGTGITLQNVLGEQLHNLNYTLDYYNDAAKKDGGWSIELINYKNPCGGQLSWKASSDILGGSPGAINSIYNAKYTDTDNPKILRTFMQSKDTALIYFNESVFGLQNNDFSIPQKPSTLITNVNVVDAQATSYKLTLTDTLNNNTIYNIVINGSITDCVGNLLSNNSNKPLARNQKNEMGYLIINEVMPYAKDYAEDWIEIYNTSNNVIDLKGMQLATFDKKNKVLESIKNIASIGFSIFPDNYVVLTTKAMGVTNFYTVQEKENIIEMESIPTFSSDSGVVLLMQGGLRLDSMQYFESMHYPLLNSTKGVSLERISSKRNSTDISNWTSAAQTIGYGTPSYKNSQNSELGNITGGVEILPNIFSPDADGYNDITTIYYNYDKSGYTQSIEIFALDGNRIITLQNNVLIPQNGSITWNGFNVDNQKVGIGSYIVLITAFNIDGTIKKNKIAITVASKF